jgi:myosin protein heavy chain
MNALERKTRAQIAELDTALAEKEEELAYLRDAESGGHREQELIERIEEDGAKLEALEAMLRHAQDDVDQMEAKMKRSEGKFQEETRRAQRLVQQHLQVKEERESLLMELNAARSEIQFLQAAKKGRPSLNKCVLFVDTQLATNLLS